MGRLPSSSPRSRYVPAASPCPACLSPLSLLPLPHWPFGNHSETVMGGLTLSRRNSSSPAATRSTVWTFVHQLNDVARHTTMSASSHLPVHSFQRGGKLKEGTRVRGGSDRRRLHGPRLAPAPALDHCHSCMAVDEGSRVTSSGTCQPAGVIQAESSSSKALDSPAKGGSVGTRPSAKPPLMKEAA